jgi:branched-chain amino acid transport system substrate-binding protein
MGKARLILWTLGISLSAFLMATPCLLAQGPKVLKIGVSATLTGPASFLGWHDKNAAILTAEEINEGGGVTIKGEKYKVELELFDNETKPAKAVEGMRLFAAKGIHISVGPQLTPISLAVLKFNEELNILFASYSTTPEVFEEGNKLALSATANQKWTMGLSTYTAAKILKMKKAALLLDTSGHGRSVEKRFSEYFKKFGGEVVAVEWYDLGSTDFYPQLTQLKAKNPDVIQFGGAAAEAVTLIRQAREILGKEILLMGSDYFKLDQLKKAGLEVSENTLIPLSGFHLIDNKAHEEFFKKYKDRFGSDPETYAGIVHDEMLYLTRAAEIAGTATDAFKIRESVDKAMVELGGQGRLISGAHGGFLPSGVAKNYYISSNLMQNGKLVRKMTISSLKEIGLE